MASGGRPPRGIEGMPLLKANVHPDVSEAIKAWAHENNMSVRGMVRAILCDFAEDHLGVAVDDVMITKSTRK